MLSENVGEIVLKKARSDGLVISRIPKPTRDEFLQFAEMEFADDYGMALKHLWDNYKLWLVFIQNINTKMDFAIQLLQSNIPTNNITTYHKLMNGKSIEMKGGATQ
jgi:hypothetical protein